MEFTVITSTDTIHCPDGSKYDIDAATGVLTVTESFGLTTKFSPSHWQMIRHASPPPKPKPKPRSTKAVLPRRVR